MAALRRDCITRQAGRSANGVNRNGLDRGFPWAGTIENSRSRGLSTYLDPSTDGGLRLVTYCITRLPCARVGNTLYSVLR